MSPTGHTVSQPSIRSGVQGTPAQNDAVPPGAASREDFAPEREHRSSLLAQRGHLHADDGSPDELDAHPCGDAVDGFSLPPLLELKHREVLMVGTDPHMHSLVDHTHNQLLGDRVHRGASVQQQHDLRAQDVPPGDVLVAAIVIRHLPPPLGRQFVQPPDAQRSPRRRARGS